ncbi:MAG: M48 family metallopeptidase [Cyclobacteriaceae bacterium]
MKQYLSYFLVAVLVYACTTVPMTGRRQLSLVPNSEILPLSYTSYQQVLKDAKVVTKGRKADMVKNVGARLQKAVEKYMADNNLSSQLSNYEWEFVLLDDDAVNAWCMPGGKVAFYTGIMPVCKDNDGVAVVMGHEVAHAVANHGRERMSQGLAQQFGGAALSVALAEKPAATQQLFNTAFAVGSTYGAMMPFSRLHESEADRMGLIFMAIAGYDPNAAPGFWKRMSEMSGGAKPPEFMSTHPSDQRRINDLNAAMPEAMKYYKASN